MHGLDRQFHPHQFDEEVARFICYHDGLDWFSGAFLCGQDTEQMMGYVMLRGWDAGFEVPSFGVCVLPEFQNMGLAKLMLGAAIFVARTRGSSAIRLKVYPDNQVAVALYQKAGFVFAESAEQGQLIGSLSLVREETHA